MYFGVSVDLHVAWACVWGTGLCLAWDWMRPIRPMRRVAMVCAVVAFTLGWDALAVYSGCLLAQVSAHWYWVDLALLAALAALTLGFFKLVRDNLWLPFRARFYALGYFLIFYALVPSLILVFSGGHSALVFGHPSGNIMISRIAGETALIASIAGATDARLWSAGVALLLFSALGIWATRHFAAHGKGTPLPLDPTRALVTSGPYAYVRNPMQISGLGVTITLALFFNSLYLWIYALDILILLQFTKAWEDAELARRFGEPFEHYAASVRRWWPGRKT
jgi:protein-S-isoprenylcysteine O-methyltransferase Ste14